MVAHLCGSFPTQLGALDDAGVHALVRDGIARAATYGLRREYDVCLFLDLTVALGRDFDALPWASALLRGEGPPPERIARVYAEAMARARRAQEEQERARAVAEAREALRAAGSDGERLDAARRLLDAGAFAGARGADAVNRAVVDIVAEGVAADPDPARRDEWIRAFASLVLQDLGPDEKADRAARGALLAGASPALMRAVDAWAATGDEGERAIARDLGEAWERAHGR
jgi:hypothetical protein